MHLTHGLANLSLSIQCDTHLLKPGKERAPISRCRRWQAMSRRWGKTAADCRDSKPQAVQCPRILYTDLDDLICKSEQSLLPNTLCGQMGRTHAEGRHRAPV